jgi:hypothetical protein
MLYRIVNVMEGQQSRLGLDREACQVPSTCAMWYSVPVRTMHVQQGRVQLLGLKTREEVPSCLEVRIG